MILNKLEQQFNRLQHKANDVVNRVRDRHIRLAVTGLSRSGKTAFITALVNQLEHAAIDGRLPLWDALRQGRILGARRVPQQNAHIPTFAYERGLDALFGDPPAWPEPTRGWPRCASKFAIAPAIRCANTWGRSLPSTWIWWTTPGVAARLAAP